MSGFLDQKPSLIQKRRTSRHAAMRRYHLIQRGSVFSKESDITDRGGFVVQCPQQSEYDSRTTWRTNAAAQYRRSCRKNWFVCARLLAKRPVTKVIPHEELDPFTQYEVNFGNQIAATFYESSYD
jgi:hypothetical protein